MMAFTHWLGFTPGSLTPLLNVQEKNSDPITGGLHEWSLCLTQKSSLNVCISLYSIFPCSEYFNHTLNVTVYLRQMKNRDSLSRFSWRENWGRNEAHWNENTAFAVWKQRSSIPPPSPPPPPPPKKQAQRATLLQRNCSTRGSQNERLSTETPFGRKTTSWLNWGEKS